MPYWSAAGRRRLGSVTTYGDNADGLRVLKDDGVDVTRFVYDGNNLLREIDGLGTLDAQFTYVPLPHAHLVAQYREEESSFYHFDGVHNTSELSDSSGVVTDAYKLDAWGETFDARGTTPNAHTYNGEFVAYYRDPSLGLHPFPPSATKSDRPAPLTSPLRQPAAIRGAFPGGRPPLKPPPGPSCSWRARRVPRLRHCWPSVQR